MVTVTTKEELEFALNNKEASILIKGELAKTMKKKEKDQKDSNSFWCRNNFGRSCVNTIHWWSIPDRQYHWIYSSHWRNNNCSNDSRNRHPFWSCRSWIGYDKHGIT